MNPQVIADTIGPILTPVVMVTNCALVLNGVSGRYGAVNDRMRAMAGERLSLLRALHSADPAAQADELSEERLQEIDEQLPDLLRRHDLLHYAVLTLYLSMAILVASMFVIALAVEVSVSWLPNLVLAILLAAVTVLLASLTLTAVEVRGSQRAVRYEVRRVLTLRK
jgi:Protein of unknown function (DUF2721)